jgi:16S rRNA (uracil1498-N3)-methyltransferase
MAVTPPLTLAQALMAVPTAQSNQSRWILSLAPGNKTLSAAFDDAKKSAQSLPLEVTVLSGPEGGLSPSEEAQALAAGFAPVSLGPRVLRAETAPVAVLSVLGAWT